MQHMSAHSMVTKLVMEPVQNITATVTCNHCLETVLANQAVRGCEPWTGEVNSDI